MNNRVILITGSRKGIGKYLSKYYTSKGFFVEGCSRNTPEWQLENYTHHEINVSNEKQVRQMLSSIRKRHKKLDIVINNAGIASMNHSLLTPGSTCDEILNTNVKGTFLICRESAKIMKKRRFGRIVNFSSIAIPMKLEGEALYASSKSAIETFTKIIAFEYSNFGITCNTIAPTPIKTDLIKNVPSEKIKSIVDKLAIKRLGKFEDLSNVIDFFIKPESDYITGQTIYLGGIS